MTIWWGVDFLKPLNEKKNEESALRFRQTRLRYSIESVRVFDSIYERPDTLESRSISLSLGRSRNPRVLGVLEAL